MISAPGGMRPLAATLWILSPSTMTTALAIVPCPFTAEDTVQLKLYGLELSVPVTTPLSRKSTLTTPTSSAAAAAIVTVCAVV